MSDNYRSPSGEGTGTSSGTSIDLGEDLLTTIHSRPQSAPSGAPVREAPAQKNSPPKSSVKSSRLSEEDPVERVKSARILFQEGLTEEAKRILHQVLIHDPSNVFARKILDEIHDAELKQIFREDRVGRRERESWIVDTESVLRRLDQDLELGLQNSEDSLFSEVAALNSFGEKLDRDLSDLSAQDRLDIGIAFLEMGLYSIAARQFQSARDRAIAGDEDEKGLAVSAAGLLGYARILDGRPYDAVGEMQSMLQDQDVSSERKVELFYLMGRANELLGNRAEALRWYRQTADIDPRYRDIEARTYRLAK